MTIALIYNEKILPFIDSTIISSILALLFFLNTRKGDLTDISKRNAFLVVSGSWIVISIVGALPYFFSGYFQSFTDAYFESVSGFTTTGSSILTNIEALPKSLLFWRSLTHWIGGIGIIVLVIVIMPNLNINNYNLFYTESSLQEKILPKVRSVGKRILGVYLLLTILETFFLVLGKMNLFDAICHSFATVATGGFSTKNTSIAGYSPYIQYIITIFMILAGTNFALLYFAFKKQFNKIKQNEELKYYLLVIIVSGLIVTGDLFINTTKGLELSFREAFFQVTSIITCTGFATSDYLIWPHLSWIIIFILMFIGGSTGSTAGGIKIARHLIITKNIKKILKTLIHPNNVSLIKLNGKIINDNNNLAILSFVMLYLLSFITGSIILLISGVEKSTAISAIATAMGGIGPGFGSIGPVSNFAELSDFAKYTISFFMILGRLEITPILLLFTPYFWKQI
jgi:trk system potassium uptake protein TrkH